MTVALLACAMLFTSSSGRGSDQATRRATPSSPLRAVLASEGVSRTCASAFESVCATRRQVAELGRRVHEHLEPLVGERSDCGATGMKRARGRTGHDGPQPAPTGSRDGVGRLDARVRLGVGEREQHARERDPIGDAVVHARVQDASLAVAVDQVEVPQRLRAVERRGHQVADQLLQRGAVAGRGQGDVMQVQLAVEVRVVLPEGASAQAAALDRALAEARVAGDEPFVHDFLDARPVDPLVEEQDGVDDHQVRRAVHAQPGCVRTRHPLPSGHLSRGCRCRAVVGWRGRSRAARPRPARMPRPPRPAPPSSARSPGRGRRYRAPGRNRP